MRNLKKVISSVAALAIVASSASAFAVTFPDVDASANYNEAVKILSGLKIVEGDENGLFNPDKTVTRAEFTKMAVGALGEMASAEAQTTSKFDDAANTSVHWAAGFIAQGVADGFIDGYDDHRFGPDDTVTYAQACKMLVASIGYTTYAEAAGGWPAPTRSCRRWRPGRPYRAPRPSSPATRPCRCRGPCRWRPASHRVRRARSPPAAAGRRAPALGRTTKRPAWGRRYGNSTGLCLF